MGIVRILLAVVVGAALGIGCVAAGDWLNHLMFPPPSPEQWREYSVSAPFYKLIGLPITYTAAAFVAAFAAASIVSRVWAGWIAGGFVIAGTAANLSLIAHPVWMTLACIVFVPLAVWAGGRAAVGRRAEA